VDGRQKFRRIERLLILRSVFVIAKYLTRTSHELRRLATICNPKVRSSTDGSSPLFQAGFIPSLKSWRSSMPANFDTAWPLLSFGLPVHSVAFASIIQEGHPYFKLFKKTSLEEFSRRFSWSSRIGSVQNSSSRCSSSSADTAPYSALGPKAERFTLLRPSKACFSRLFLIYDIDI